MTDFDCLLASFQCFALRWNWCSLLGNCVWTVAPQADWQEHCRALWADAQQLARLRATLANLLKMVKSDSAAIKSLTGNILMNRRLDKSELLQMAHVSLQTWTLWWCIHKYSRISRHYLWRLLYKAMWAELNPQQKTFNKWNLIVFSSLEMNETTSQAEYLNSSVLAQSKSSERITAVQPCMMKLINTELSLGHSVSLVITRTLSAGASACIHPGEASHVLHAAAGQSTTQNWLIFAFKMTRCDAWGLSTCKWTL